MSKHSKRRRDARRRNAPATTSHRARPSLQPHAQLTVDGAQRGVVARQGDEWVLFLDGQAVASTDSAGMTMAMLKRIAQVRDVQGGDARLAYSTTLRAAATCEADAQGLTLHAYLDQLEAERDARRAMTQIDPAGGSDSRPEAISEMDGHADGEPHIG